MNYSEYDAETLFSVGRRFLNGDCVEKDIAKAKAMLGRAAEMGHPLARKLMESISDDIQEEKDDISNTEKSISEQKNKKNSLIADYAKDNKVVHQLIDLALLQNGMLKGAALNAFLKRSVDMIGK